MAGTAWGRPHRQYTIIIRPPGNPFQKIKYFPFQVLLNSAISIRYLLRALGVATIEHGVRGWLLSPKLNETAQPTIRYKVNTTRIASL